MQLTFRAVAFAGALALSLMSLDVFGQGLRGGCEPAPAGATRK